jgi:hypothetical protein
MTEGRLHPPRRLEATWPDQAARELLPFAQTSTLRHPMPAIVQRVHPIAGIETRSCSSFRPLLVQHQPGRKLPTGCHRAVQPP